MKTIKIKSLTITNFKGIKSKRIEFGEETSILGANASGKTTVVDAWHYLLFGKDSTGRTAFEIKPLDKNNNPIHKLENEVEASLVVDGEDITLRRTHKEKWVKRRGSKEAEYNGNETLYHWNDVPMSQKDYMTKVSEIVNEEIFKLITSPSAFNSMKWQDQRQVLLDISGGITQEDVAKGNPDFEDLLNRLGNKTIDDYGKQIKASIKKSKDELKGIPTRIDEVVKNTPEGHDWKALDKELEKSQGELQKIEDQISDQVKAHQLVLEDRTKLQNSIYSLEREIDSAKHQAKMKAQQIKREESSDVDSLKEELKSVNEKLQRAERTLQMLESDKKDAQDRIQRLTTENDSIRQQWLKINAEKFSMPQEDCKCPTCHRELEAENIEAKKRELEENFITSQKKQLETLSSTGKVNASKITELQKEVAEIESRLEKGQSVISGLKDEITSLQDALTAKQELISKQRSESEIYHSLLQADGSISEAQSKIDVLKEQMEELKVQDNADLKTQKNSIVAKIEEIKAKLSLKDQITKANERVEFLKEEESNLAQAIADLERDQFTIEGFQKAEMNKLEELVNERFSIVKFKLFEQLVNGGEVPTCKSMVNGVPYSDVNTAGKIQAGLDIINVLSKHYGVQAPVFIDNRESVTELIPTDAQIINLVVSPDHQDLTVKVTDLAELF